MRKTYKFSSSVAQGGWLYSHKTTDGGIIKNKGGLKNALKAVAIKFGLIDVTIKVYDFMFFFFFMMKPSVTPNDLIESVQKNIASFADWAEKYLYTGVYDLQEDYVRKDLKSWVLTMIKGSALPKSLTKQELVKISFPPVSDRWKTGIFARLNA